MILATDFPRKLLPHSTNKQHTYTEYNFRNTFCFRERVLSHHSILKDYVHIFDLTLTSEAGRCSLSIDHCQREECAGELVSAFKLLLYAQYRPQGDQSMLCQQGCQYCSVESYCKDPFYKLSNCFPLSSIRVGRTSKGRLGSVVLSTAVKICSVFSSYSSLEVQIQVLICVNVIRQK